MKRDYGTKIRAIRKAEGFTQAAFSNETDVALSSIRYLEAGGDEVGISVINRILDVEQFQKYTLWLMIGKTSEVAGQIAPALSHFGPEKTDLPQLTGKGG